jgi:LppP/LprE lipoprotein
VADTLRARLLVVAVSVYVAIAVDGPAISGTAAKVASWLDDPKPASWNAPGLAIPAAPKLQESVDPRCRALARPAELDEDKRLGERGWDLVGDFQGGWQIRVMLGTAGYDGMCRPRQYQGFVFVRGVFAGTLAPQAMDSRTDGALGQVHLESAGRLMAEYRRYAPSDPLCCPSRTTSVVFAIANDTPVLRPVSASTSSN